MEEFQERQKQDKYAALHYAVLSDHPEIPETGEENPLPK